ncbi:hypothetical protein [Bacillus halotolerans]|uniref:hypothetical protein n=1 Tax=Bacillus halotolerans TaxID=260554 RepID=UPI002DBE0793|nr:hypothetical protein [Bacillus halotolerans]MEC1600590.1 hypothetical protein [Bacillus halotolerans]
MAVPDNYINKGEARKLGWESKEGNLSKVSGEIYTKTENNETIPQVTEGMTDYSIRMMD